MALVAGERVASGRGVIDEDGYQVVKTTVAGTGGGLTDAELRASSVPVGLEARTTGGTSVHRHLSTADTNLTSVKASGGQVYGWYLFNANAAVRYLKLYNKASAPVIASDTPVMTVPIPGGAAANVPFPTGIVFGTGIALAIVTGVADTDTGAVAANEIIVNLLYK